MIKFLVLFVVCIFLFGFYKFLMFFHGIFGQKPNYRPQDKQTKASKGKRPPTSSSIPKKIITSDEGEYVDYVEIKD